ncbi:MAG: hypothetical protein DMD84_04520 [Candidatus Rokuibacteriota bacterium]|nr:MAG: hypothetical protein DMD84_04520 [Candidatus Rokubacteria bacterium]
MTSWTSHPTSAAQNAVTARPAFTQDRKWVGPSRSLGGSGGGSTTRLPSRVTSCTRPAPAPLPSRMGRG